MSQLKERLQDDIKNAMKAKDMVRLGVLRFLSAALKQREIDERITLSDEAFLEVLIKLYKQRKEAISQFSQAGRSDLVEKETLELAIIEAYLPEPLSQEELDTCIQLVIDEVSASSLKDMGKVMNILRPRIQGRADLTQVSQRIKALLVG